MTPILPPSHPNSSTIYVNIFPLSTKNITFYWTTRDYQISFGKSNQPYVSITFPTNETSRFNNLTTESVKKFLTFLINKIIQTIPIIRKPITNKQIQFTLGKNNNTQKQFTKTQKYTQILQNHITLPKKTKLVSSNLTNNKKTTK